MKTRKVGIIGLGHVGAHVAYSLAVQGIADELVLMDMIVVLLFIQHMEQLHRL